MTLKPKRMKIEFTDFPHSYIFKIVKKKYWNIKLIGESDRAASSTDKV